MEDLDDDDAGTLSSCSTTESSISSSSNARASRNMAEKQRRDNLNTQIGIISTLVPFIPSDNAKRRDKISILRLAVAQLRLSYVLGKDPKGILPPQFKNFEITDWIVNNMCGNSGFFIVVTSAGNIAYVSKQVERHLGYDQRDMLAQSIKNFVFEDDHAELFKGLTPDVSCMGAPEDLDGSSSSSSEEIALYNGGESSSNLPKRKRRHKHFEEQRRSFYVRMAQRSNSRRENVQYEYVQFFGTLRLAEECRNNEAKGTAWTPENCSNNDVIFCGFVRLLKKKTIVELSILDSNKNEYFTRHLVDGRIIYCDHRISLIAGYMSEEVSGTSAFTFIHKDDAKWTIVALRHMYDHGKNYGSSCYRLMTKTGEYIYLRTHGYLEWDEATQSVSSFICINTLISQEEGEKLICEMKERYSATISSTNFKAIRNADDGFESETDGVGSNHEEQSIEDASQLEDAITCLISDLPSPTMNDDPDSAATLPDEQIVKAAMYSKRLPPASIQASKIGINNSYPCLGKNGKGKPSPSGKKVSEESSALDTKRNGEKRRVAADKKIPELEESLSPIATSERSSSTKTDKGFMSPNPSESTISYSKPTSTDGKLKASQESISNPSTCGESFSSSLSRQTNDISTGYIKKEPQPTRSPHQINLKRQRNDPLVQDIPVKRKITDEYKTLELLNVDSSESSCIKKEMNYSEYLQDVNEVDVDIAEDQYVNFNEKQLIGTNIDNSEMIKLFTDVPPSISFEGTSKEENLHQYSTGDAYLTECKI